MRVLILIFALITPQFASASESTFTGFWKIQCTDAFGAQIKPYNDKLYSVSFCGPGGCDSPGVWKPNTTIINDPNYKIIDNSTVEIYGRRFLKCTDDTNPKLDFSTMEGVPRNDDFKVKYLETYKGLPEYDKNTPFTNMDSSQHIKLEKAIADIRPSDLKSINRQCKAGSVLVWKASNSSDKDWRKDLSTNICNPSKLATIKKLVSSLAPSLDLKNMTAWVVDLDGDKDLLIGYIDISKEDKYPYISFWRLKPESGIYKAYYAGPFLDGSLHAVRAFGEKEKNKAVFIKHASCIECEPLIYLTAIDFDAGNDARAFEFTYNEKHDGFAPTLEYELPGMGHTVEAKVEVRLLPPSSSGPHLLQFYKMAEGPNEWWSFTCKNYKCDYQEYKDKSPDSFKKLWKIAKPL